MHRCIANPLQVFALAREAGTLFSQKDHFKEGKSNKDKINQLISDWLLSGKMTVCKY